MSEKFEAARDFLLDHAQDHEKAYRDFRWPEFDTFNWAFDWFDHIASGPRLRQTVADSEYAGRFTAEPSECTRIAVGSSVAGWHFYDESQGAATVFEPAGPTAANDPLQLYFTSGTTSKPKLVVHSHTTYPVGHLSTMYWIGLRPGDIHCNVSAPGWAKHAWSCVFAPWNA